MEREPTLIAVGVVPPPVSGKSEVTQKIFNRLEASAHRRAIFIKAAIVRRGWGSVAVRAKMTWAVLSLVISLRLRGERAPAYLVAEGGLAIALTVLHATLLRLIAAPLVVHHHGRYWLERPNLILRALLFNRSAIHLTQCAAMSAMAHEAYGPLRTMTLTNAFIVSAQPKLQTTPGQSDSMRLAHLSNLTLEKGLGRVIATFAALKRQGASVTLRLGGPLEDKETERLMGEALMRHPEIEWLGYVSHAEKDAFFDGVDAFLFPTQYDMETEGIVTLEAMARGIPVIATDLCCLKDNLAQSGGEAIPASRDFPSEASGLLSRWCSDRTQHREAQDAARQRFAALRARSEAELNALLDLLSGGAPTIMTNAPAAKPREK